MVNATYPKPITDWMGRTIRTEVPRTATTHTPDVANLTTEMETYHLTRGGIPSPTARNTQRPKRNTPLGYPKPPLSAKHVMR
jgi:hypothetical protein